MPITPTYPGVYIEEISSGVRTITGVATSITAFFGRARRGEKDKATTIHSFGEFERIFGGLWIQSQLGFAVRDFYLNGGSEAIIVRLYHAEEGDGAKASKSKVSAGGVKLEAAYEGAWGANLRASVDMESVSDEVALSLGVTKTDLFNLAVLDAGPGGTSERFLNLTVKESARLVDRVLKAESKLVRWDGTLDPSSPPTVAKDSDAVTKAEAALVAAKKALEDKLIADPAADVTAEKQSFKQSLKKSSTYKDRATLNLEENDGKKTTEMQSDFSWGDLNDGSAELKISGKEIYISAKAKNDFIRNQQGSSMKGYDDEIKFYAQTPSDGSVLMMAIQKIIPAAKKELQVRLPKLATKEEGFKILKDRTKDFKVNESNYSQKITLTCLTSYDLKSEVKGKTIDENFKFNFSDLSDYKLSVSKEVIKITAKVIDNKKFIKYTKDGVLQNYDNSIDFILGDLEDARYLAEALPAISKGCKSNVTVGDFNSLVSKLKSIENPKQELILQDGSDKCKWKFTTTMAESKKTVETISEWNLYDIDPKKIDIDVSGKTVGITAYTLNKEKFIKQTKDSKSGFSSEINLIINDIEDAQKALATFKNLVEGCKK